MKYHLLSICGRPDLNDKTGSPIVEALSNLREHISTRYIAAHKPITKSVSTNRFKYKMTYKHTKQDMNYIRSHLGFSTIYQ